MEKISAYKKCAGFVMAILMGLHIFSGLRLFCPGAFLPTLLAIGIEVGAVVGIAPGQDGVEIAAGVAEAQSGASKCCCKKQKQCPVIPRAAITSNPTQRFNDIQRQFTSECCHSLVAHVTAYSFVTGSGPPVTELAFAFSSPLSPFSRNCALLI